MLLFVSSERDTDTNITQHRDVLISDHYSTMSLITAMEMIMPQPSGGNVPGFLAKLWKMVNNPKIGWSSPVM